MIDKLILDITNRPGIYKFLDENAKIIYIGKALNLKKRVSSYFNKSVGGIKTQKLVEHISDIEVIITENEEEALILENTLIKKHKPRYNILLRDDKSYPYIYIDTSHNFPSIKFYRGSKNTKKGIFFGPYTQVAHVRYMLNLTQKIFKIRSCEDSYFNNRDKPCLQHQINRCDAPCVDLVSKKDYGASVKNTIFFLQGKNESLINKYNIKMENYSSNQEFEEASVVRDKISMIRSLTKSKNIINNQKDLDIITYGNIDDIHCIDVFLVRDGVNLGNKTFEFKSPQDSSEIILNSFFKQYYLMNNPPKKIVIPSKFQDSGLLINVLSKKHKKSIKLIYSNRKPYSTWSKICQTNTDDRLQLLLRSKSKDDLFASLNSDLKHADEVENIICFDISHLSGSSTQGSCVWFTKNGPQKNLYRRYNVVDIKKSDDYGAIKFVMGKRLKKLKDEGSLPDLIVVDGGKGQITQAKLVLKELDIFNLIVLGIVKGHKRNTDNDRILDINFNDITVTLSKKTIITIQKMRDEAHRFAIIGQRHKSNKKQYNSKLDSVPGIGKIKKIELLKYFGGIQGVLKSSAENLTNVPGISVHLADIIYNHLHNNEI
ncbi:excinuclease ABC subunit UvrC [Gammaproteobacteria bacterium]|nr:excinuclease ABC subunit UvrC [Gammaproteobacteria bacterium]